MWLLCSFQGPPRGSREGFSTRSLKTQQHANPLKPDGMPVLAGKGLVDVSSTTVLDRGGPRIGTP